MTNAPRAQAFVELLLVGVADRVASSVDADHEWISQIGRTTDVDGARLPYPPDEITPAPRNARYRRAAARTRGSRTAATRPRCPAKASNTCTSSWASTRRSSISTLRRATGPRLGKVGAGNTRVGSVSTIGPSRIRG